MFRVSRREIRQRERSYETRAVRRTSDYLIIGADNCGVFSARGWIISMDIKKPGALGPVKVK